MPYKIEAFGLSDVGLIRQNNEDVWAAVPECNFFALADGMGGHRAGEVAAQKTIETLCDLIRQFTASEPKARSLEETHEMVAHSIEMVNSLVYDMGCRDPELRGMGTTLCCLQFHKNGLIYAHVGDSRIYRLREEKLNQMTRDHSLLRELVDLGQIDEENAGDFQYKNIITKAVGTEACVEPSIQISEINADDIYLMCSDGLSDLLTRTEIEEAINRAATVKDAAKKLVELAIGKGGHDNITVVMLEVQESKDAEDISR